MNHLAKMIAAVSGSLSAGHMAILVLPGMVLPTPVSHAKMCRVKRTMTAHKVVRRRKTVKGKGFTKAEKKKLLKVFDPDLSYQRIGELSGIAPSRLVTAVCALRRATVMARPEQITKWLEDDVSTASFYKSTKKQFFKA